MNVTDYLEIFQVGLRSIGKKHGKMDSHGIIHSTTDTYSVTTTRTVYKVSQGRFTTSLDIL